MTRRSRRYPAKVLSDQDLADDIAMSKSTMASVQAQLINTEPALKDLGLIINVSKREYMTVNCNYQPSRQVYNDPTNHVTGFTCLGSKMASAASDLKRRKALA